MRLVFFAATLFGASLTHAEVKTLEEKNEGALVAPTQQMTTVTELDPRNFNAFLNNSTQPVVVEFYASRCPPCRTVKPVYADVAKERGDVSFAAINVEKDGADTLMSSYNVEVTPTFVVFRANKSYAGKIEGGRDKNSLKAEIDRLLRK